jgi:SAM-dependent methyltransferase
VRAQLPELPIPPPEMRRLVGREDAASFDNPSGDPVYAYLPEESYEAVFEFGCGCGRIARQLIQQNRRPMRYLGIDLHRGMIEWCRRNLAPHASRFEFEHHDVFNAGLNPGRDKPMTRPFPARDRSFSLVEAVSVFTHLVQTQAEHYLREVARILRPGGIFHSTWFLFEKSEFPMLSSIQNALYTNEHDLSSAVLFDREWLRATVRDAGLTIVEVIPPEIRNFHWYVLMTPSRAGIKEMRFPIDEAPAGSVPPPAMPAGANRIGLESQ